MIALFLAWPQDRDMSMIGRAKQRGLRTTRATRSAGNFLRNLDLGHCRFFGYLLQQLSFFRCMALCSLAFFCHWWIENIELCGNGFIWIICQERVFPSCWWSVSIWSLRYECTGCTYNNTFATKRRWLLKDRNCPTRSVTSNCGKLWNWSSPYRKSFRAGSCRHGCIRTCALLETMFRRFSKFIRITRKVRHNQ